MATISIAGNTLSGRLGAGSFGSIGTALTGAKKNTNSLTQSLDSLRGKVNAAATAADVSTASASTSRALSREEQKQGAMSLAYDKLDTMIADAGQVDNAAAGKVEQLKKDFYKEYGYLKPECEKSWREKAGDAIKGAWDGLCSIGNAIADFVCDAIEWVKKNLATVLKALAVIALLVVSILLLATGVGGLLAIACIGCIVGILGSLLTNGIGNLCSGKNFFDGAIDAMLIGGITGAIDAVCTAMGHPYVGSMVTSLLRNGMECALEGKELSIKTLLADVVIDLVLTGVTKKIFTGSFFEGDSVKDKAFKGANKLLAENVPFFSRFAGQGSYKASYKMVMTKLARNQIKNVTWKTIRNGMMPMVTKKIFSCLWDFGEKGVKGIVSGGLNKFFDIDFDFTIGGKDLFKLANIS